MSATDARKGSRHAGLLRRLGEAQIDSIFESAATQEEYLVGLHKAVVPEWDAVEGLSGHVACSADLWDYIARKAIEWDGTHCPAVFAGGAWLNWGFSVDRALSGGQVALPPVKYRKEGP